MFIQSRTISSESHNIRTSCMPSKNSTLSGSGSFKVILIGVSRNPEWVVVVEEVLNQPEPLFTADFGDTVMADSLEVYEGHINIEEV